MTGWHALAEAVRRRRDRMGLRQNDLENLGGPSGGTIRNIEQATRDKYASRTLRQLETALRWPEGTAADVVSGQFTPDDAVNLVRTPDRAAVDDRQLIHPHLDRAQYDRLVGFARQTHRSLYGAVEHLLEVGLRVENTAADPAFHNALQQLADQGVNTWPAA